MRLEIEFCEFGAGDHASGEVLPTAQTSLNREVRRRLGSSDETNNGFETYEGATSPIHRDVREETVSDLVPLARAWGEVALRHREAGAVGEVLQGTLPESRAVPVASSAVCGDEEVARIRISRGPSLPTTAGCWHMQIRRYRGRCRC